MSSTDALVEIMTGGPTLKAEKSPSALFSIKSANQWMDEAKCRPIPKMLFSELWHEGELCILFADTNLGKSVLAVQIGSSIAEGRAVPGFTLGCEPQEVLYLDFELSDKQFEGRYSANYQHHYRFDKNLIRAEINPEQADFTDKGFRTFEEYLYSAMESAIISTGVKVLIVDNITYLRDETEKARGALPLMKDLQRLKKQYGLSILCLAHTPKRDMSQPITINDLQGSKMLMNFCDSSFAIGGSVADPALRYLKQIKQRQTASIYHSENVIVCRVSKPHNFLMFEHVHTGREREHLKKVDFEDKDSLVASIQELAAKGMSQREIAKELSISVGTVNKYIKNKCSRSPESGDEHANG